MTSARKSLEPRRRRPATVTYSHVPPTAPVDEDDDAIPTISAVEVPLVDAPQPIDAIRVEPRFAGGEDVMFDEFVEPVKRARKPRWFGLVMVGGVIAIAAGVGIVAASFQNSSVPKLGPSAPMSASEAEIQSLNAQIAAIASDTSLTPAAAKEQTAELRRRLAALEEGAPGGPIDMTPSVRVVGSAADAPLPDATTPAPSPAPVAALPPVPRERPDHAVAVAPEPLAPAAASPDNTGTTTSDVAAVPPANDADYVKNIEQILAATPESPDAGLAPGPRPLTAPLPVPAATAAAPATEDFGANPPPTVATAPADTLAPAAAQPIIIATPAPVDAVPVEPAPAERKGLLSRVRHWLFGPRKDEQQPAVATVAPAPIVTVEPAPVVADPAAAPEPDTVIPLDPIPNVPAANTAQ